MARLSRPHAQTLLHLTLLTALVIVVTALFVRRELAVTGGVLGVPLDDAFIHFQYARNISRGLGFSFNAGQPTPGSTAPAWTLLLALVALPTDDLLLPALLLSSGFLLATVWLTYGFTRQLSHSPLTGLLAGGAVALTGRFLWAGLAGMETTAFAACSVGAVWLYHRRGLGALSGLLFGLAAQLRPEGHLLFALATLDTLFRLWRGELTGRRGALMWGIGVYLLVSLPYPLFSLATTGRPLPNTFYAKADAAALYSWRTLRETTLLHAQDNPAALLLLPLGLLPTWRRERLVVTWPAALWLLVPAIVAQVWHHGRYTLPLVPFQMTVAALGAQWLYITIRGARGVRIARWVAYLGAAIILLAGVRRLPYWAGMLGTNSREIQEVDQALGRWLADNTPPDAVIAVDDIGAIAYLSGREVLDLQGLVSPELWPVLRDEYGLKRNQALTRALSGLRPDYVAIFPNWHSELAANPEILAPVERFHVDTHTIIFGQEAVVYRPTWPYQSSVAPEQPVGASLGGIITLDGYDLAQRAGELGLTLYWRSLAPADTAYDVFVHLLDQEGNIVAQLDEQPLRGLAPTTHWQPGDLIRDPRLLRLPPDLNPGSYRLLVGMFQRESGVRLPVDGSSGRDAIFLQELELPARP